MKIRIKSMVLGPVETNCYIIENEENKEAVVIDPADHGDQILQNIAQDGFKLTAVLLTHGHFDHITGLAKMEEARDQFTVYASQKEVELLYDTSLNCSTDMGDGGFCVKPDRTLSDQESFTAAGVPFVCIETPGHTSGSCCYFIAEKKLLFAGDTVFAGSVGRTDLPTGSMKDMKKSIEEKLRPMDDDIQVFPGHGPYTTIGDEKRFNPFF